MVQTKLSKKYFVLLVLMGAIFMLSVLAGAVTFPQPFSGGETVIVVGERAAQSDRSAAQSLMNSLGTNGAGPNYYIFQRSSNLLNLGESLNEIEATIDVDQLPGVLGDETFRTRSGEEYDYEQSIMIVGDTSFGWFEDNDFNQGEPGIGLMFGQGEPLLNYTLAFDQNVNVDLDNGQLSDLEDSEITILGREYTILSADNDPETLRLLGGAVNDIIMMGETQTYTVGGRSYTIEPTFISADEARFRVNGNLIPSLEEGETFSIDAETEIGVREINYQDFAGGIQQAEFVLGAQVITLTDGEAVEVNDETVDELEANVVMTTSGNTVEIERIVLTWIPEDDVFIAEEAEEVRMPVFEGLRFGMEGFVTSAEEELVVNVEGGDTLTIEAQLDDGMIDIPLLTGDGTNFVSIGEGNDQTLVTSATNTLDYDMNTDENFIASWNDGDDAESYLLEVNNIDDDDGVTVRNVVNGNEDTADVGDSVDFGNVELTITAANEGADTVTFQIGANGNFDEIYTQEGLTMLLPVNAGAGEGSIDLGASPNTYDLTFIEEDEDGNIKAGEEFTIPLLWAGGDLEIGTTSNFGGNYSGGFLESGGNDDFVAYVMSPLATRIMVDTDAANSATITYHGDEAYARIYLAGEGGAGNGTGNVRIVTADQIGGMNLENANVMSIGGSCVNSLTAEMFDHAFPTCGDAFESATGVGDGEYIIENFSSEFGNQQNVSGGRIVTVIAGYNAADTREAVDFVLTGSTQLDLSPGRRFFGGMTNGTNNTG